MWGQWDYGETQPSHLGPVCLVPDRGRVEFVLSLASPIRLHPCCHAAEFADTALQISLLPPNLFVTLGIQVSCFDCIFLPSLDVHLLWPSASLHAAPAHLK